MTNARLNTVLLMLLLIVGIAILATLALRAEGGPLDPPGPPGSTDSVRLPGTPISSLPFAINSAGYYYVTRDLTAPAGQNGITINVSNVTIDLGGFRLLGGATPGDGIIASGGFRNITIRNGSVRGFVDGVDLSSASMSRVDDVQSSSNSGAGFRIGLRSVLSDCNASLNSAGIDVNYGMVRGCIVSENTSIGINVQQHTVVERNFITGNAGYTGIDMGSNNTVRDNEFTANTGSDFDLRASGDSNVIIGNVYCNSVLAGTGNMFSGNTVRTVNCP